MPDTNSNLDSRSLPAVAARVFATTRWSLVRLAGQLDSAGANAALESLCRDYWVPLYAFARRRGFGSHDAEDLTQAFFAELLGKNRLRQADAARGRFRTFLLTAFQNFLANEWDKAKRLKRGGDVTMLPLDTTSAEQFLRPGEAGQMTPEAWFDRQWAEALTRRSLDWLRAEMESLQPGRYAVMKDFLEADKGAVAYADVARRLGLSLGAAKTAIRRMRLRFAAIVREEVARTSPSRGDAEEELRHLLAVLKQ